MRVRSSQYLLLSILSCAFLLSAAPTATACSCGPRPTVLDEFEESDEVVTVRVLSVEKGEDTDERYYVDGVKTATLIVERVFKGKLKVRDEIVFGQGGGADCIWTFNDESIGDQFLFYLASPKKFTDRSYLPSKEPGLWFAFGCGRSTGLAGANEDLLYLENMRKRRGQTRISGSIGGGFAYPNIDVEGKRIKLICKDKTYETKTDKDGIFEIYDLPPGKYFIEPEMERGWKIDPDWLRYSASVLERLAARKEVSKAVAVILEPKKHASVDIVFTVENYVRGRVIGPKGKPMDRVCVYLLRPEQEAWGPSGCTNEQGRFEITSIPPGEYVLVANQNGKPSTREPFQRTFYPNVSERERAAVISISTGDTIDNIDIVIPKLEETITIEGVLRYSDDQPVIKKWVNFKVTRADSKVDGNVSEQTDSVGRFTLRVLKGLTGEVAAEYWLTDRVYKNCPKVDEILAKSGSNNVTVQSNVVKLTTEQDVFEVELTLPFPRCEKAK
jgi:hypothetical protein